MDTLSVRCCLLSPQASSHVGPHIWLNSGSSIGGAAVVGETLFEISCVASGQLLVGCGGVQGVPVAVALGALLPHAVAYHMTLPSHNDENEVIDRMMVMFTTSQTLD